MIPKHVEELSRALDSVDGGRNKKCWTLLLVDDDDDDADADGRSTVLWVADSIV